MRPNAAGLAVAGSGSLHLARTDLIFDAVLLIIFGPVYVPSAM
jgi:hypothetical protein